MSGSVSNLELMLATVGLLGLLVLPPLAARGLQQSGHVEANFRGDRIPQSFGVVILLWASLMLPVCSLNVPALRPDVLHWMIAIVGFGLLGLLDDLRGDKKIKGIRGHFRAALVEHRITTGFIKAVGGGLLALALGIRLFPHRPADVLITAALIALTANAINLFDLRPGRACAVFFLGAAVALLLAWSESQSRVLSLWFVLIPTLTVYLRDRRAQAMMGDTGSNLIGGSLGLALALLPSLSVRLFALALLFALHLVAERLSITQLIERQPLLRALDRLTGVR